MVDISLGGISIVRPNQIASKRFTMLLWGPSGCGKTTLASTAPGKKLYIQFDPGGTKVLADNNDTEVLDLSDQRPSITDRLKGENPLGIEKFITDNGITTVVLDSLTTLSNLCLENAVRLGSYKGSTLETPGLQAYGHRNAQLLEIVKQLLRSTGKTNTNLILIAHENTPEKDKEGVVIYISIMLGGALPEYTSLNLDEVWWMQDTGKDRRIAIRPVRSRKPMKSRMFKMTGEPEFMVRHEGIGDWYDRYIREGRPIDVPK